ncbi:HNH endonuclease signature motif containing protein, partial [Crystallibacter degradans]|uniref:HNH endonuclease signature motif containing protein n=1 Tax=Crystallibacter degradans TaxID=2726743 RepID=UPI0014735939
TSSNALNSASAAGNAEAATSAAGTVLVADAGVRGFEELDYRSAVEQLVAGRRLAAWLDAGLVRLTHRIGQTAVEELPPPDPGTPPAGRAELENLAEQSVVEELACLYRITEHQARGRYERAQELCEHYPGTLAALTAGDLDLERAGVITRQGDTLPDDAKPGFEQALLVEAPDKTPGELRSAARKQREKLNPETITVRRERQEQCRNVYLEPADDGMAFLGAYLPAEEAYAAYDRLTQSARSLQTKTETRTLGQLRADVFIELLLNAGMEAGPAAGIRPEVALTVPVFTLMGLDEEPATLDGYGPIPADTARKLCEGADSFYRILTHPETGTILSYGKTVYRPPADLARAVRHRDTTCTAPGCHVPAKDCDLDHTIDYHANGGHGRTDFGNLGPRCGSDHRLKSLAGWKVTQTRPGEYTTTTPGNQTYTTKPGDTGAGPPSFTDRILDALPDNFRNRLKPKKPPPPEPEKEPPF